MTEDSVSIEKGPCEKCGSWYGRHLFSDGHYFCFACPKDEAYTPPPSDGSTPQVRREKKPHDEELAKLLEGAVIRNLPGWDIQQSTCQFANYYTKALPDGTGQHIAVYLGDDRRPAFAKVRKLTPDNDKAGFFTVGDKEEVKLWGWETLSKGGKMCVIAEGEKDRMAGLQLWQNRFPVAGLPLGAEGSEKAFAKALPDLQKFDKVVIATDMDGPGRDGAERYARMLPPGKAYIAEFPSKDLHQTVVDKGSEAAIKCLHNAKPYSPDGIVDADDISLEEPQWGLSLPWPEMYEWTYGFVEGNGLWVGGAGIGMGKSDQAAEIVAHHIHPKGNYQRAALFNYESGADASKRLILTKLWGKNFSIRNPRDGSPNVYWSPEDLENAERFRKNECAKLYINDHKGVVSWPAIKDRIRYLKHSVGITLATVDPVAALVAAEKDKTTALDLIFAEAKALTDELGITILLMSHMARPAEGPSHEEGGRVTLSQFRGSNSIAMWADVCWGTERNAQAEDETERNITVLRMLKVRLAGQNTGKTMRRAYSVTSGKLEEIVLKMDQKADQDEGILPPPVRAKEDEQCGSGSTSTEAKKPKRRSASKGTSAQGSA